TCCRQWWERWVASWRRRRWTQGASLPNCRACSPTRRLCSRLQRTIRRSESRGGGCVLHGRARLDGGIATGVAPTARLRSSVGATPVAITALAGLRQRVLRAQSRFRFWVYTGFKDLKDHKDHVRPVSLDKCF